MARQVLRQDPDSCTTRFVGHDVSDRAGGPHALHLLRRRWLLQALVEQGCVDWMLEDDRRPRLDEFLETKLSRSKARAKAWLIGEWNKERPRHRNVVKALGGWFDSLARLTALEPAEAAVLAFAIVIGSDENYRDLTDAVYQMVSTRTAARAVSRLLGLSTKAVDRAIRRRSPLLELGLMTTSVGRDTLCEYFVADERLCGPAEEDELTAEQLLKSFFRRADRGKLSLSDFPHLKSILPTLVAHLARATAERATGVNILIHGPPGSGKTELVHAIADALSLPLVITAAEDDDGMPLDTKASWTSYRVAQASLGRAEPALLLVDECDRLIVDLETDESPTPRRRHTPLPNANKYWLNQRLETNLTPTLWVANSTAAMDNAHLRRFDMIVPVSAPPASVRKQIAHHYLDKARLGDEAIDVISSHEHLQPAHIARLARVLSAMPDGAEPAARAATAKTWLRHLFDALGHPPIRNAIQSPLGPYRLDWIAADTDLERLVDSLRTTGSGRCCFHGPPGTGKTEFARELARRIDRPLLVKRLSDLLSKWVGETEAQIAAAFAEATDTGSVLLMDECDTLLGARDDARARWEVSETNELLGQLECFEGVLVCTTNRLPSLDAASLRRFDFKVRFEAPSEKQLVSLWQTLLTRMGVEIADPVPSFRGLLGLTVGDFAVVARNLQSEQIINPVRIRDLLHAEWTCKPGNRSGRFGFSRGAF